MKPELLSIVFTVNNPKPVSMPYDQGRALAGQFLAWVQMHDSELSSKLHSPDCLPRPFTISNFYQLPKPKDGLVFLPENSRIWFRVTSISDLLSKFLIEEFLQEPPVSITVAEAEFCIAAITHDPSKHLWAGCSSYNDLVNEYMLRKAAPKVSHQFTSATCFHKNGNHLPFVLPSLAIGSWLRAWNAYAPITMPVELIAEADRAVAISYYKMQSVPVRYGKATFVGGIGNCTFTVIDCDPYWRHVVNVLSAFSFYCGTGVKTALGLGQTRRLGSGAYRGLNDRNGGNPSETGGRGRF